jgi:2-polyprenyl-6-methoxyphenol hydroxylase-like FAD-dependent oxidoreductase
MRVLIVGAGIGGLALANRLSSSTKSSGSASKSKLSVQVFERHSSLDQAEAGYGLHLGAGGVRSLQSCISTETFRKYKGIFTPAGSKWAFRDSNLGLLALRDDAKITGRSEELVQRSAVQRDDLRQLLIHDLDPLKTAGAGSVIQWGKQYSYHETLPDGSIRAHFDDGTSVDGDVLIGADGAHSKVRQNRLPRLQRDDLGMVIIVGRYQLDTKRARALPAMLTDGSPNNIVPYGRGWLFLTSFASAHDGRRNPFTLWAYAIPKSQTPKNAKLIAPEKLRDMALAGVKEWQASPYIETVVRDVDVSTVSPIVLKSMPRLESWTPSNVTLLGDAIHCMTPMAGVGANTALRDAQVLGDLLVDAHENGKPVVEAIGQYERQMRTYANEAVGLSRMVAETATSESWVNRRGFLASLRLAQNVPFVMSRTIGRSAWGD